MLASQKKYISNLSWTEFEERAKSVDFVIIPSGSCEAYGKHLPLGADTLIAQKISELISFKENCLIAPTLPLGDSTILDDFCGTITVTPEAFKKYLKGMLDSLVKWGIKNFLFITGHAGNVAEIKQLSTVLCHNRKIKIAQVDYWRFIKSTSKNVQFQSGKQAFSHAGEAATSVFKYLFPELVNEEQIKDYPLKKDDSFPEILKHNLRLSDFSKEGTIGFPSYSSKKEGEIIVNKSIAEIILYVDQEFKKEE